MISTENNIEYMPLLPSPPPAGTFISVLLVHTSIDTTDTLMHQFISITEARSCPSPAQLLLSVYILSLIHIFIRTSVEL